MTQGDADALQQFSKLVWNSEIWRVAVNVQHRFEHGYEPSDMDFLRLDLRQPLSNPESRIKHQHVGSVRFDTSFCGLRLERSGEIIVACGDSSEKVLAQFKGLVGKTLTRIDIALPLGMRILFWGTAWLCVASRHPPSAVRAGASHRRITMN